MAGRDCSQGLGRQRWLGGLAPTELCGIHMFYRNLTIMLLLSCAVQSVALADFGKGRRRSYAVTTCCYAKLEEYRSPRSATTI